MIRSLRLPVLTPIARFAGSIIYLVGLILGLTPQALCCRALRALSWRRITESKA
jgi:hypothetical protein